MKPLYTPKLWPMLWPRLWPRTLGTQLVLVTVLAVVISNMVVVFWFSLGHQRDNMAAEQERFIDRAASTAILLSKTPPDVRDTAVRAFSGNFWGGLGLHKGTIAPQSMSTDEQKLSLHLRAILPAGMASSAAVYFKPPVSLLPPPDTMGPHPPRPNDIPGAGGPPGPHPGEPHIPLQESMGRMLYIVIPISPDTQLVAHFFRPPSFFWPPQLLLAAIVTILIASLAAAYIAQRVTRPLAKLAAAASNAAHGGEAARVPEQGPQDVRRAAAAFNAMNDQVKRTLESQRHLLSAVGHDLRTPITAMRINIEFVEDEELAGRLAKNLDELQALTEAVLSAARGTGGEKQRQMDITALAESLCADLDDLALPVSWLGGASATLNCRPNEMRRAIRNLIENAVHYGKKAEVSIVSTAQHIEIRVEDEGPGIPPEDRERVFEPFVRLEASRNMATGGVGLGLTLVHAIAQGHGGKIVLAEREDGKSGLSARMILPRRDADTLVG